MQVPLTNVSMLLVFAISLLSSSFCSYHPYTSPANDIFVDLARSIRLVVAIRVCSPLVLANVCRVDGK